MARTCAKTSYDVDHESTLKPCGDNTITLVVFSLLARSIFRSEQLSPTTYISRAQKLAALNAR